MTDLQEDIENDIPIPLQATLTMLTLTKEELLWNSSFLRFVSELTTSEHQ